MTSKSGPKPMPLSTRIVQRATISPATGCWEWPSPNRADGYGRIWVGSRSDDTRRIRLSHVVAYEEFVGPIADGLEVDHLCRNRSCCNPDHLEAVTHQENMMRSSSPVAAQARQTHCKRGHEFTAENTDLNHGKRYCIACRTVAA